MPGTSRLHRNRGPNVFQMWQAETEGGSFQDFLMALREPQEPVESLIIDPSTGEPYDIPPSVPTDDDGEIPLRSQLMEILAKIGTPPTEAADVPLHDAGRVAAALLDGDGSEVDVAALLEALATEHEALKKEHATLQEEHADLIEQVGQVLDAVGQIPTEQAERSVKSDWMDYPTLTTKTDTQARTPELRMHFEDAHRFREVIFQGQVAAGAEVVIKPYWYFGGIFPVEATGSKGAKGPVLRSYRRDVYGNEKIPFHTRVGLGDKDYDEGGISVKASLRVPPANEVFDIALIRARIVGILL